MANANLRILASVFIVLVASQCAFAASATRSKTRTRTMSYVPIAPAAVPTLPVVTVVTFRLTGVATLPLTATLVNNLLTTIAATAQVARTAVVLANTQIVQVANANVVQVNAYITAATAADSILVAQRINTDVQDGTLGSGTTAVAVTGVITTNTPSAPVAVPPAAPAAPTSTVGRVRARFSVIITGIDLSTFSADQAAFRTTISNYLSLGNPDLVTIIDRDLITYAKKFTTTDAGVRVIFDASMPNQAAATNALSTLQASINANGGRIGAYNIRNLQTTTSDGSDAAVWARPAAFFAVLASVLVAMMF